MISVLLSGNYKCSNSYYYWRRLSHSKQLVWLTHLFVRTQSLSRIPITRLLRTTHSFCNIQRMLLHCILRYQGAYSMSLEKIDLLEAQPQIPNVTLDPFSLPGCYPYERRLIQKDLFTSTPDMLFHDLPRDGYFTDMYVRKGKIYLVRDDYNFLVVSLV